MGHGERAGQALQPMKFLEGPSSEAGLDGWVSLEVSPRLAYDTAATLAQARSLHTRAGRPNLFIRNSGTPAGLPAIAEAIFAGVPVNVPLLFTREQYLAAEAKSKAVAAGRG